MRDWWWDDSNDAKQAMHTRHLQASVAKVCRSLLHAVNERACLNICQFHLLHCCLFGTVSNAPTQRNKVVSYNWSAVSWKATLDLGDGNKMGKPVTRVSCHNARNGAAIRLWLYNSFYHECDKMGTSTSEGRVANPQVVMYRDGSIHKSSVVIQVLAFSASIQRPRSLDEY